MRTDSGQSALDGYNHGYGQNKPSKLSHTEHNTQNILAQFSPNSGRANPKNILSTVGAVRSVEYTWCTKLFFSLFPRMYLRMMCCMRMVCCMRMYVLA